MTEDAEYSAHAALDLFIFISLQQQLLKELESVRVVQLLSVALIEC
jgi:hypothetical protein